MAYRGRQVRHPQLGWVRPVGGRVAPDACRTSQDGREVALRGPGPYHQRMVCKFCKVIPAQHEACKGGAWCDCGHRPRPPAVQEIELLMLNARRQLAMVRAWPDAMIEIVSGVEAPRPAPDASLPDFRD